MRTTRRVFTAMGIAALLATSVVASIGTPTAGAAASNTMTVTAGEYTYKVSGKPKPGNVEVVFDNAGVEYHMLAMAALKPGVTVKQLTKALMSDDEKSYNKISTGSGEVSPLPGFIGPDQSTATIVNLKAGRYGMFCFVPAPDGTPHFVHGMVSVFDVSGSKSSFKPPTDGVAEVTLSDTAITLPGSGLPKSGWVKVTNDTDVTRSLLLGEYLTADATFDLADAYFNDFFSTGQLPAGDPPASINGGVTQIEAGKSAYFQVDLDSGRYTLVSSNDELEDDPNEAHADFTVS